MIRFEKSLDGPTIEALGGSPFLEHYMGSHLRLVLTSSTLRIDSTEADVEEKRIEGVLVFWKADSGNKQGLGGH